MTLLLKTYRIALLLVVNVGMLAIALPLWLLLTPFKNTQRRLLSRAVRLWARSCCHCLGIEVRAKGDIKIGEAMFIVSNHLSYTDIPVLASLFDCVFVSKHEVRRWPLIGLMSYIAGTVFVDRGSARSTLEAIKATELVLGTKRSVVIFAEATTSDGIELRPFKTSFFALPERLKIAILPVAINYYYPDMTPCYKAAWYGDMNILKHFSELIAIRRLITVVTICESIVPYQREVWTRKELARLTEQRVREAYYGSKTVAQ